MHNFFNKWLPDIFLESSSKIFDDLSNEIILGITNLAFIFIIAILFLSIKIHLHKRHFLKSFSIEFVLNSPKKIAFFIGIFVFLIYASMSFYVGISKYDAYMFIDHISNENSFIRMADRPLAMIPWYLGNILPDVGLIKFHLLRSLFQALSTAYFFLIIQSFTKEKSTGVAFFASLFFAFYPSDITSSDLMSLVPRYIMALSMILGYIFIHFSEADKTKSKLLYFLASLVISFFVLFSYEAAIIPLLTIPSIILFKSYFLKYSYQKLNLSLIFLSIGIPLFFLILHRLALEDTMQDQLSFSINYIFLQLIGGLSSSLISGPAIVIFGKLFGLNFLTGIIALTILVLLYASFLQKKSNFMIIKSYSNKFLFIGILFGIFLTTLYFSIFFIISTYPISIFTLNRINYFPSIGSSIFLVFSVLLVINFFTKNINKKEYSFFLTSIVIVFLFIGSKVYWAERDSIIWNGEEKFWSSFEFEIPNKKSILILKDVPDYLLENNGSLDQYITIWLRSLYPNRQLIGVSSKSIDEKYIDDNLIKITSSKVLVNGYKEKALKIEDIVKEINIQNTKKVDLIVNKNDILFLEYDEKNYMLSFDCLDGECTKKINPSNFYINLFGHN